MSRSMSVRGLAAVVSCTLAGAAPAAAQAIAPAPAARGATDAPEPAPAALDPAPVASEPPPIAPAPAAAAASSRKLSPRNDAVLASYSATHNDGLTTRDLRLKAAAPVVRGNGFGIALLAGYDVTHLDVDLADREEHLELHRFEATVAGGAGLAPGWSLRGSLGAAYSSDLQDGSWSALQITSSAMVHHVLGPSDAWVAGIVYVSSAEFFPVLPIVGYVHQRDGSRFRLDVFLPRHVRAEYEVTPRVRSALGIEAAGNTWIVQVARTEQTARRAGGSVFGEVQVGVTDHMHVEARLGVSVGKYTIPTGPRDLTEMMGAIEQPLRAAGFAQLSFVLAP